MSKLKEAIHVDPIDIRVHRRGQFMGKVEYTHIVKYEFNYGSLSKIETIVELFIELPSLLGESKGFT